MSKRTIGFIILVSLICFIGCQGMLSAADKKVQQEQKKTEQAAKAKKIDTAAILDSNHPPYEPGYSCNDCHEIKIDAKTTATQVWLTGESPGKKAGEGIMPKDKQWEAMMKVIGGKKFESHTYVLGTCLNNVPLTTTAEFTLNPEKKVFYGFHEKGTEKLNQMRLNPKVSLNWHKEFKSFADFCCVQIKGHAELIESSNPEFEQALIDFLPYERGARVPANATVQQRKERLKQFRDSLKKGSFVISKIYIDQITMATIDFTKEGYRRYQRWTR